MTYKVMSLMNKKMYIFIISLLGIFVLSSCGGGGGGSASSAQLYSCAGTIIPYSSLVTSTCVPINSSPATTYPNGCCRQNMCSYDPYGQSYACSYSYFKVGVNSCTAINATYTCPK